MVAAHPQLVSELPLVSSVCESHVAPLLTASSLSPTYDVLENHLRRKDGAICKRSKLAMVLAVLSLTAAPYHSHPSSCRYLPPCVYLFDSPSSWVYSFLVPGRPMNPCNIYYLGCCLNIYFVGLVLSPSRADHLVRKNPVGRVIQQTKGTWF